MGTLLYFNCDMGAAGDMITAALMELADDKKAVLKELNQLNIPGVHFRLMSGETFGHEMRAEVSEKEKLYSSDNIKQMISDLNVHEKVKTDAINIMELIMEAKRYVYHKQTERSPYCESAEMDTVAEVIAAGYLMNNIDPDLVRASPIHVGSGSVTNANGRLPIPVPEVAYLLRGIPIYGGKEKEEFCTITGAAILKYYVNTFGDMPEMLISKTGYGLGKKKAGEENCIAAHLGRIENKENKIVEIQTNLDDMIPEDVGYAMQILLAEGALDVYTTAINMKKNRPAVLLSCICLEKDEERIAGLILKHTTSLGVRVTKVKRYTMNRKSMVKSTCYGEVRYKEAEYHGIKKIKPEYEDLKRIAEEKNISLYEVRKNIMIPG